MFDVGGIHYCNGCHCEACRKENHDDDAYNTLLAPFVNESDGSLLFSAYCRLSAGHLRIASSLDQTELAMFSPRYTPREHIGVRGGMMASVV